MLLPLRRSPPILAIAEIEVALLSSFAGSTHAGGPPGASTIFHSSATSGKVLTTNTHWPSFGNDSIHSLGYYQEAF